MNDLRTNIRAKLNNLISSNNNDFNQIANELLTKIQYLMLLFLSII